MPDHRTELPAGPVHLTVEDLPSDVVQQIREAQIRDPALLRRILLYGMTHKAVFETLSRSWGV